MNVSPSQVEQVVEPRGPTVADTSSRLGNQDAFLQLLVAQIQHQNPMNPSDGIEFMTQLTQFSQLEQTLEIRKELQSIRSMIEKSVNLPDQP